MTHNRAVRPTLPALLHALSDPARLRIVMALADGGEACCRAAAGECMPRSTLSNHFRVLREAGLVEGERQGRMLVNRLRRDAVDAAFPGLLDAVLAAARR